MFRAWSTPPPTGASLQSYPYGPAPRHPTSSFSLELPQAPARCTSAAGPPRTGKAERATFTRVAGPWGRAQASRILHLLPSLRRLGAPWLGDEAPLPGPRRTWASALPRGVLGRVSPGAAQAEPCNWRSSLQHRPSASFPGSEDPEAGLPVTPAHPSAPPFLPRRRLLPAQGRGRPDAPRSTGERSQGASSEPWEAPTLRP